MSPTLERLASRIQSVLPQHLLTAGVRRLMRIRISVIKNVQIRLIARLAGVDWSEAVSSELSDYPTFNDFFTRSLKPGVRPFPLLANALASPCDGRISEMGSVESDQVLQAKGRHYSLRSFLADDPEHSTWNNGTFFTIYLSPRDYHRVHMPLPGRLRRMTYVPGDLFSVAPYTVRQVEGLFARNERVISIFDTPVGPVAIVLVGAMLVAGMETVWAGEITPAAHRAIRTTNYGQSAPRLERGEEMGRFNMGSTVVVLLPPGSVQSLADLKAGDRVRLGQQLAALNGVGPVGGA